MNLKKRKAEKNNLFSEIEKEMEKQIKIYKEVEDDVEEEEEVMEEGEIKSRIVIFERR